jgi:mannitol-1-phosphate 5-dehydrogenase
VTVKKTIIIFGAGKTGRGFIAHLAYLGVYDIVLVDKNHQLVESLSETGHYHIHVIGDAVPGSTIYPRAVYHIDDSRWYTEMLSADLLACSVFGNNLADLAKSMAGGLKHRRSALPGKEINLITCENYADAASFLKKKVSEQLKGACRKWLDEKVGFCESMILSTCLNEENGGDPLAISAQNFFEWPCDGEAFKGVIPHIYGLKPLTNFRNQVRRKIFTYNCINAVIAYMGAQKGYMQLHESANDQGILQTARKAAAESSEAQIAEYGFDRNEQYEWVETAFKKFADKNIPDPIARNGADPLRKLARNDRLTGPALLAVRHKIRPEGIIKGILAGFDFYDEYRKMRISDIVSSKGIDAVLNVICGLRPDEELYGLIKSAFINQAEIE